MAIKLKAADFDCAQTLDCGQAFRWQPLADGWWAGVALGRHIAVRCQDGELEIKGVDSSNKADIARWTTYFDLDTDYSSIKKQLAGKDEHMSQATNYGGGIHILRQEPFETLISFIISANNNIPRIRKCIEALAAAQGIRLDSDGEISDLYKSLCIPLTPAYAFCTPEWLASQTPEYISDVCHAGYRCTYIVEASRRYVETGGDISDLRSYLGVGPKVEACVKLFTATALDVFPTDVWVRRVCETLYFNCEPTTKQVADMAHERFGDLAGYAQQYLFYWFREEYSKRV